VAGLLFLSFFFLGVYILLPLGYYVAVEAECNWYIHDINIFPLSKNVYMVYCTNNFSA
jgi:TM2 domain-containing membrane protein YozV